jgi:hypothetical protein
MAGKTFWNAVPVCVLLKQVFLNGFAARSAKKIPLGVTWIEQAQNVQMTGF